MRFLGGQFLYQFAHRVLEDRAGGDGTFVDLGDRFGAIGEQRFQQSARTGNWSMLLGSLPME